MTLAALEEVSDDKFTELPLLLTVMETAKILRITRPKIYLMIQEGLLHGKKVGSDWRIQRISVEKYSGPIPASFLGQNRPRRTLPRHLEQLDRRPRLVA